MIVSLVKLGTNKGHFTLLEPFILQYQDTFVILYHCSFFTFKYIINLFVYCYTFVLRFTIYWHNDPQRTSSLHSCAVCMLCFWWTRLVFTGSGNLDIHQRPRENNPLGNHSYPSCWNWGSNLGVAAVITNWDNQSASIKP